MRNPIKKASTAYWAQVTKMTNFLERKELPQTAFAVKSASLFPLAIVMATPFSLLILAALPPITLALPVVPFVLGVSSAACVALGAYLVGTSFAGEALANYLGKRKIKTVTNEAGQTVKGSAFDLSRLNDAQKSITAISTALSIESDGTRKEQLSASLTRAFDKAAPYAARVTVINDPANENNAGGTYAFVKTQKTTSRATAA